MEYSKVCQTAAVGVDKDKFVFNKVVDVKPLENFILETTFENGSVKKYDVSSLFPKWDVFLALRDIPGLFNLVKVEQGGYAVSWNDELDLSCNELWNNGK